MAEAALVLFHHQNTFLYFRHVLPNHTFIKPQILLDTVNGIVHYKVNVGELKGFPANFVNQLKECVITEKMISFDDQLPPHFKRDVYEVTDAISLFCHTFTLAPLEPDTNEGPIGEKDREYLMSLKPPIPNEKVYYDYIPKSYDTVPLVVKFSNGCVPLGCFSSTISCLLSKYGWEVIRKGGSPKCYASNIASLRDPDLVVDVILVDFTHHLEIHISTLISERPSPSNICTQIQREKAFGGIQKVFKSMLLNKYQVKVSPAIICTWSSVRHYATFANSMLCCSESSIYSPNPKQSLWMGEGNQTLPSSWVLKSQGGLEQNTQCLEVCFLGWGRQWS